LVETIREGGVHGVTLPAPVLAVQIGAAFFKSDGCDTFLEHAAGAAAEGRRVAFEFPREMLQAQGEVALLHQVSLNLPRAAYISGTETKLFEGLKSLVSKAVSAHLEKRELLEGLLDEQGLRPLGLLSRPRVGKEGLDLYQACSLVAIDGLNECVQVLIGNRQLHETEDARAMGERILAFLAREIYEQGERSGIRTILAQNNDLRVSQRFATLDAQAYPKTAATTIKADENTQALHYTTGVRLSASHGLAPMDAVRHEGRFHAHLAAAASSEMPLTATDLLPKSMADFLKKVHEQTQNRRVVFRG
jgi:ribonucleoside-triphosphate reductase